MVKTLKQTMEARPKILNPSALEDLLEKTRLMNRALLNRQDGGPEYQKLAHVLSDLSAANVYLLDQIGKILGYGWLEKYDCSNMFDILKEGIMPGEYTARLNQSAESVLNHTDNGMCAYNPKHPCVYSNKHTLWVPISGAGERLGTLVLARFGYEFDTRDLVLAEYLATVVGIEILEDRGRSIEERGRERLVVQMAMRALSYSEIESIRHIIADLGSSEGVVIASKVADRVRVTRSVIVNALRKLSSAGIIESRSLGMKGTYIHVQSKLFLEELGFDENFKLKDQ